MNSFSRDLLKRRFLDRQFHRLYNQTIHFRLKCFWQLGTFISPVWFNSLHPLWYDILIKVLVLKYNSFSIPEKQRRFQVLTMTRCTLYLLNRRKTASLRLHTQGQCILVMEQTMTSSGRTFALVEKNFPNNTDEDYAIFKTKFLTFLFDTSVVLTRLNLSE